MPLGKVQRTLAAVYPRVILPLACLWFAQLYATLRQPYLDLHRYALGQERMPFQGRDLMRWPLLIAGRLPFLTRATAGRALLHSPEALTAELIAAVSLLLAGLATVKLYRLAEPDSGALSLLPFALLITLCWFDFISTVPYTFPYDLPATAFTGWGSYFAMRRRFWPLLALFVLGTWNRETMLFVLGVLFVTAAVRSGELRWQNLRPRDWAEVLVLACLWVLILWLQKHAYRHNPTEAGLRVKTNLHELLRPLLWPNILSASAFLLPWVFLHRHCIRFAPLRSALLLLPLWILLLLSVGQILELRIYGDISVPIAVAASVILVRKARQPVGAPPRQTIA